MKQKLNKLLLCLLLMAVAILPAHAQTEGSITVALSYQDQPQGGIGVGLCQIAGMEGDTFYPTAPFADSGMDLAALINRPDASFAEDLLRYIRSHEISCTSAVTDPNGTVTFDALPRGIYLVFCEATQSYTFKPYLVFIPRTVGGETLYAVSSAPKTEALSPPPQQPPAPQPEPTPIPTPDMGDPFNLKLWLSLLALSGAGIAITLWLSLRKK